MNLYFAPAGALSLFAGARLRGWREYLPRLVSMAIMDPIVHAWLSRTVARSECVAVSSA